MKLRAAEHAGIRNGNTLLVSCQGEHRCGGWLRVPFSPPLGDAREPQPLANGMVWKRESGESVDDLTLAPSIDADECGHFHIRGGEIVP